MNNSLFIANFFVHRPQIILRSTQIEYKRKKLDPVNNPFLLLLFSSTETENKRKWLDPENILLLIAFFSSIDPKNSWANYWISYHRSRKYISKFATDFLHTTLSGASRPVRHMKILAGQVSRQKFDDSHEVEKKPKTKSIKNFTSRFLTI